MFILVYIISIAGFIYLCKKVIEVVFRTKDKSLHELAGLLKARYQEHATIERLFYPDHPLPIEQCYLHLALMKEKIFESEKNKNEPESGKQESREYFLHEYERIQHIQRKLKPEELLIECRQTPKRIYIEGAAGAGKTTLSQFIAYQWAKGQQLTWQQYEFVFRIRLRDLTDANYPENKIDLLHVIEKECFKCGYSNALTVSEKHKLDQYLKSKNKKILFILDGYDELSLENKAINDLWESIIQSDYDFIITSRPGMQKADLKTNLNIAVLGFSDEQVKKYIDYFFDPKHTPDANIEEANQCLQTFNQNINLWSLAHTPIQLELLCNIWGDEIKQTSDITLTHIYTLILEQLLKRYEQKRLASEAHKKVRLSDIDVAPLLEKFAVHLEFLKKLAFAGMERSELVIPHKFIEEAYKGLTVKPNDKAEFFAILRGLGLVTRDSDGRKIEFIHLTFQEYFAARYIVRCFRMQQTLKSHLTLDAFIAEHKYHRRYEIVWWFVAGLLKDEMELLDDYFNLLQSESNDLAEIYQFELQLQCLAECELQLKENSKEKLLKQLESWIKYLFSNKNTLISQSFSIPTRIINQPKIVEALNTNIHNRRNWEFAKLSNLPEQILKQLIANLPQVNQEMRSYVSAILSQQITLSESIFKSLIDLLKYENTQRYATKALSRQIALYEPTLQQLVELLNNENVRAFAGVALSNQTSLPVSILLRLVKLLANKSTGETAAKILSRQTILPEIIIKNLLELLCNDVNAQIFASKALSKQCELSESFIQQLIDLFENSKARYSAALILSRQVALSERVVTKLKKLLDGDKANICAGLALSKLISLPENFLQQLVYLLKDPNMQGCAAVVLSNQISLPQNILKDLKDLLNDKNAKIYVAKVLSRLTSLPEPFLQQLIELLKENNNLYYLYQEILLSQTLLPERLVKQLCNLLTDKNAQWFASESLSKQISLPKAILQQLIKLLNNDDIAKMIVADALSGQKGLPKAMLAAIAQAKNISFLEMTFCIKSISIASLCAHLNLIQCDDANIALLKLIILKCLKQKLSLYFYKNKLYVGGEAQGKEFSPECQEHMTQELEKLFTEMTGIPASTANKNNLFDVSRQSQESDVMKEKNGMDKQMKASSLATTTLFVAQTSTRIGSSIPYALANHQDYKAVIKQKIQDGPGANPEYKLLLQTLIDPRYKEEKEFIKEQMNIIIQCNSNKEANHFLRWLEDNYEKVKGARQTVEFENNAIDLYIRENQGEYPIQVEVNTNAYTPANIKSSP